MVGSVFAIAALAIVVAARFWLGLVVSVTALKVLRSGGRWRPTSWVGATTTAEVALVSAALYHELRGRT